MNHLRRTLSTPILLLGLAALAYGVQALWLGYYLDDWVVLYHITRGGLERLSAYAFDVNRPFGAWPWWVGYTLFGLSPLKWQLWSILWRWLTTVLLGRSLGEVWPERKLQISLASALFIIYPIFGQQSNAVTFSAQWICFALYGLSILLMVSARKRRQLALPLTGLSLLASTLQLFTIEYFAGMELLRPLILWFQYRDIPERKPRLKKTLLSELPYALVFTAFAAWRLVWIPGSGPDRNVPTALYGLFNNTIPTVIHFAVRGLQDTVEALAGTWYKTYQPATMTPTPVSNLISWGIAVLACLAAYGFFFFKFRSEPEPALNRKATGEWLGFGLVAMLAGFLPVWAIDQHLISTGNYADRFGLAAMFGASLFTVALASSLLKPNHRLIFLCLLVGLGAGYHFRLENTFRWNWEKQSRLAWQLHWRMPGLQPQTTLFGDGTLAAGSWVDIAWINFIYGKPGVSGSEQLWYFDLAKLQEDGIPEAGEPLSEKRLEHLSYQGNSSDSIVIQFKSVENQCLWVVDPDGLANPDLTPLVLSAAYLSNPSRIAIAPQANSRLEAVFPGQPGPGWCYYFEKADLAVQEKQWAEVQKLWQEAEAQELNTAIPAEYLPFIDGLARAGDYETALALSRRAKSLDDRIRDPICQAWKRIFADQPAAQEIIPIRQEVDNELGCG